jgi:ubiquinol-cytochrome c reductase cytochrome b subunit
VPLALVALVVIHILLLHEVGSNNPDGVEIFDHTDRAGVPLDGVPFQPYFTVHDIFWVTVFLACYAAVVFFVPEGGGYFLENNNFVPADPLKTPQHIAPVWYFTPFYSMLRATTDVMVNALCAMAALGGACVIMLKALRPRYKVVLALCVLMAMGLMKLLEARFIGVVVMGSAVLLLFFLPWLDRSPVKSIRYRPSWHRWLYGALVVSFVGLGYLGTKPPSVAGTLVAQVLTVLYFTFFLLMPVWSQRGKFKPLPSRLTRVRH